jgi:glycosyltransferase involved in cell wall biosynthesis
MKAQRILHVVASMDPKSGGVCQAVRSLIKGFEGTDVVNEVVSLDSFNAPYIQTEQFVIHAIGPGRGPWSYCTTLIPWLESNLSRFEAIVLHGLWLYPSYAVQKLMGSFRNNNAQKFFVMPHGMLDPYFQRATGRRFKAIRNWLYWKLIEGQVINKADGLLFTCEQERLLSGMSFKPYYPNSEIVIGLGVEEPPAFNVAMVKSFLEVCPEVEGKRYFLFLSRIHEKKGVDLLVKAYRQLKEEFPNEELPVLVIAGPGMETPYGKIIKKLVSQDQVLEQAVFFPGMLSGDAKWGAFYGCEAFVLPSHQENFGIAVVEAMACGKAVLISDQVNIWREIERHRGGMVRKNDLNGCLSLLESWMLFSKEEKYIAEANARNCYERNFKIFRCALLLNEVVFGKRNFSD